MGRLAAILLTTLFCGGISCAQTTERHSKDEGKDSLVTNIHIPATAIKEYGHPTTRHDSISYRFMAYKMDENAVKAPKIDTFKMKMEKEPFLADFLRDVISHF